MIRMMSVNFLGFVSDLYGFVSFQYDSLTSIPVNSNFSQRHQVTARIQAVSRAEHVEISPKSSPAPGRSCSCPLQERQVSSTDEVI